MKKIVLALLRGYKVFLSPVVLGVSGMKGCKHEVSCSLYTLNMVEKYGIRKGLSMGVRRLLNCR